MTKEVIKYDIETAVITALADKYADVKITDGKSYQVVMDGLAEYRGLRAKIDSKHKELKADAVAYGKSVDAEKRRLKGLIEPGEQHLKDVRQVEDDRKLKIKQEKERIEQERIDAIKTKIEFLHSPENLYMLTAEQINQRIDAVEDIEIDDTYMEFQEEAKVLVTATLNALYDAFEDRQNYEKKEVERKAEIEKLNRIKEENEAAQAKIDAEKAQIAEGKRLEAEAKDRAEFERIAKEAATATAEKEAKDKIEREKQEKVDAENEAKRKLAMLPDKEKLIAFADMLVELELPAVKSKKAMEINNDLNHDLDAVQSKLRADAEAL